jgi:hypothetical protein
MLYLATSLKASSWVYVRRRVVFRRTKRPRIWGPHQLGFNRVAPESELGGLQGPSAFTSLSRASEFGCEVGWPRARGGCLGELTPIRYMPMKYMTWFTPMRCISVIQTYQTHAYEMHVHKVHSMRHPSMRCMLVRCIPVRCTLVRCRPVRYTPMRYTSAIV